MTNQGDREAMIDILGSLGVPEAEVPASLADASAMASDVVLARGDVHSFRDLVRVLGDSYDDTADRFIHLGIDISDPDKVQFSDADVKLAEFLRMATADDVLTEGEGQEIIHVIATSLAAIAEAGIAAHVQGPEQRTENFVENARLNAFVSELGLDLATQLSVAFRHHLRQAAITNRRTQHIEHRELVNLTVGFLDLVGFTTLSQELEIAALVDLVKGFESRAHELAHETSVRIVKLIGDEVMIVAEKPSDAAEFVGGMIASLDDDSVVPRGGLTHGGLINIHGDYFGPVVNLAARLTDSAVPGEVLVDDAVAAHVAAEPAGRRMLKGFDEPIRVHSLILEDAR